MSFMYLISKVREHGRGLNVGCIWLSSLNLRVLGVLVSDLLLDCLGSVVGDPVGEDSKAIDDKSTKHIIIETINIDSLQNTTLMQITLVMNVLLIKIICLSNILKKNVYIVLV